MGWEATRFKVGLFGGKNDREEDAWRCRFSDKTSVSASFDKPIRNLGSLTEPLDVLMFVNEGFGVKDFFILPPVFPVSPLPPPLLLTRVNLQNQLHSLGEEVKMKTGDEEREGWDDGDEAGG